ncbi:BTAD domain-containing putative transcriptional regulator [Candidatus Magnetomonas plexicatena]|uniref:BTAD domain-containing putative transcriptional regulator n=1 Tax=Candidatus Magnetomonas plexicatena TaxID=2552947 RepID=UPI001C787621|nr:hypothetical protein E2O03_008795 [Nitrospirales bacterium LBB_01]
MARKMRKGDAISPFIPEKVKFLPPKISHKIMIRSRIVDLLSSGLNRKMTLLCATGGYGKSVQVKSFLDDEQYDYLWYNCDERDNVLLNFILHIVLAIAARYDLSIDKVSITAETVNARNWQKLISVLFEEIIAFRDRIIVVIDSYHLTGNSDKFRAVLKYLLEHCPDNLHIILLTIGITTELRLSKFIAYREVLEISEEELRFDNEEIKAFFNDLHNINLTQEDIETVASYCNGWPLALDFIAHSYMLKRHDNLNELLLDLSKPGKVIYDYIYDEIYSNFDAKTKLFLRATSIVDQFDFQLYNLLFEFNQVEFDYFLSTVQHLIVPCGKDKAAYEYHRIFLYFLRNIVHTEDDNENFITELHKRAAAYYNKNQNFSEALQHAILAKDYNLTVSALENVFSHSEPLFPIGLSDMYSLIKQIPDEVVDSHAIVIFALGWAYYTEGDFNSAIDLMIKAKEKAVAENNVPLSLNISSYISNVNADMGYVADAGISAETLTAQPLKIYMFENMEIFVGDRKITVSMWNRKKAIYIFAYMVFHSNKQISTDSLIDTFFEDVPLEKAKASLRQCIGTIRKILQPDISQKTQSAYLETKGSSYILTIPQGSYVDAFNFEQLISSAKAAAKENDNDTAHSLFKSALEITDGCEFLKEDPFSWAIPLREKYIDLEIKALLWIAMYHYRSRDYGSAIEYANRCLMRDAYNETCHELLIRTYMVTGRKNKAVQTYNECVRLFTDELQTEPSPSLKKLLEL